MFKFISFLLAVLLYLCLIFGFYIYKKESMDINKVFVKKKSLEITVLVEKALNKTINKKDINKVTKIIVKSKKVIKAIDKVVEQKTIADVDKLFSSINTNKYKTKIIPKTKIEQVSFLKSKDYMKDINKTVTIPKKFKVAKSNDDKGEVNKYMANISDVLTKRWENTVDTKKGSLAVVQIHIDLYGVFLYVVKEYSKSEIFNKKLQDFLETQSKKRFDKPKNKIRFNIKFKDD